jgi:hypothetical protein
VIFDRSVVYGPPFLRLRNLNELPVMTTSQGTTRIVFPSAVARDNKPKAPKAEAKHTSTFGVVYANAVAQASMLSKVPTTFPAGSVIVREKLASPDATNPELLAVMIKRAQGFSRKAGDWDYLLISGDGTKVLRREKKDECRRCHAGQVKSDFVFPEPPPD